MKNVKHLHSMKQFVILLFKQHMHPDYARTQNELNKQEKKALEQSLNLVKQEYQLYQVTSWKSNRGPNRG